MDDFEEEPEDPAEVAEDVVDNGLSLEMDEVASGKIALAFGAGSAVAVGFASEPSLAGVVGAAKFDATDTSPCRPPELPSGFEAKSVRSTRNLLTGTWSWLSADKSTTRTVTSTQSMFDNVGSCSSACSSAGTVLSTRSMLANFWFSFSTGARTSSVLALCPSTASLGGGRDNLL